MFTTAQWCLEETVIALLLYCSFISHFGFSCSKFVFFSDSGPHGHPRTPQTGGGGDFFKKKNESEV